MRSRESVGKVFLESGVDSIVFQAGVVIGSGSASFEMIRHLAETLPVMPAPVPAPRLAGLWVALVTPIPWSMSLPLVESLQHDAVSREHDVDLIIPRPDGGLTGYRRAVALALGKERDGQVETTWANAGADADPLPSDPECLIFPAMSRNIARAAADLQASDAASP